MLDLWSSQGRWAVVSAALIALAVIGLDSQSQQQNITSYLCYTAFGEDAQLTKRLAELSCAANFLGDAQAGQELARLEDQLPSRDFIRANPNEALPFFLAVVHGTNQPTLTLLLLVYGLQRPFALEGKEDMVHRLSVPRGDGTLQAHVFRYEIPPLAPGMHNVSLVLIGLADADTPSDIVTFSADMSIYVGEGEPPKVSPARPPDSIFQTGVMIPETTNFKSGLFLSLTPNATDQQLNNWQVELSPGQRLDYYMVVRNCCGLPGLRDHIVTPLLDGHQLPIGVGSQEPRAHIRLSDGQQAEVPASLIAPQQAGSYLLVPFGITNPYNLGSEANPLEGPLPIADITPLYTIIVKPSASSD